MLSYLAAGMSEAEVLADFPELTREDILACLSFAADREGQPSVDVIGNNRERIAQFARDDNVVLSIFRLTPVD